MFFDEDKLREGQHIYVTVGSKKVVAVYLKEMDSENSLIAVVVKSNYEDDISFKKINIPSSLIERKLTDEEIKEDIIYQHRYELDYENWMYMYNPMKHIFLENDYVTFVDDNKTYYAVYDEYFPDMCHYYSHSFKVVFDSAGNIVMINGKPLGVINDSEHYNVKLIKDNDIINKIKKWNSEIEEKKAEEQKNIQNEIDLILKSVDYQAFVESFRNMSVHQRNAVIDNLCVIAKQEDYSNKTVKLVKNSVDVPDLIC